MQPDRESNQAVKFLIDHRVWLSDVAERIARRKGLRDCGEDLVQELFRKLERMPNEEWAVITNKEGFVWQRLVWLAGDLFRQDKLRAMKDLDELTLAEVPTARSTSPEAMEAAILVNQLCRLISPDDLLVVRLLQEGHSRAEMAARLGLSEAAARTRVSRLVKKLRRLTDGTEPPFLPPTNNPTTGNRAGSGIQAF